jgi:hypothetical protein
MLHQGKFIADVRDAASERRALATEERRALEAKRHALEAGWRADEAADQRALELERRAAESERRARAAEQRALETERRALEAERRASEAAQRALGPEQALQMYVRLCLADASEQLSALLFRECAARGRLVAEPILLLCAGRLDATKFRYWADVAQFSALLGTPLSGFCLPAENEPEELEGLRHRVLRFTEIFVLTAALGRRVGSRTLSSELPSPPLACSSISGVGRRFRRVLDHLANFAATEPVRPCNTSLIERELLGALLEDY